MSSKHPEKAAKITGMLLEPPWVEVESLLVSDRELDIKVTEALAILDQHAVAFPLPTTDVDKKKRKPNASARKRARATRARLRPRNLR